MFDLRVRQYPDPGRRCNCFRCQRLRDCFSGGGAVAFAGGGAQDA